MRAGVACDAETVIPHIIAVNAVVEHIPVCDFPKELVFEDENYVYVKELDRLLERCYEEKKLPNELGISWAATSKVIQIQGYDSFRGTVGEGINQL